MKKIYKENAEALTLCDEVQRLTRRRNKLNVQITEKREKMRLVCTHAETKIEDSYVEGGYLDKSQHIKTTICIVCGKELDKKIIYGGFN
jgi:transposase